MPGTSASTRRLKQRTIEGTRAYYEMLLAESEHKAEDWHQRALGLMEQLMAAKIRIRELEAGDD